VQPVAEIEENKDDSCGQMRRDEKDDEILSALIEIPSEQGGDDHAMSEAGYRKEFRESLYEAENDGLHRSYHTSKCSITSS
jgi:hypothetical protein